MPKIDLKNRYMCVHITIQTLQIFLKMYNTDID
jgi:hypothetical protein